ncbi:hypothetical protein ACPEH1_17875 [Stenotrophomonas sp. NPDC077421]|uniref:hypothetical protein n=1 Tax=Stenotrophomonas sp. NPDC077421 TaxID=3414699 RepID=UPI003C2C6DEF
MTITYGHLIRTRRSVSQAFHQRLTPNQLAVGTQQALRDVVNFMHCSFALLRYPVQLDTLRGALIWNYYLLKLLQLDPNGPDVALIR